MEARSVEAEGQSAVAIAVIVGILSGLRRLVVWRTADTRLAPTAPPSLPV